MRMKSTIYLLTLLSLVLFSCQSEDDSENLISEVNLIDQPVSEEIINTFYNVPSPSEQFEVLSSLDGYKKMSSLNSLDNSEKYTTSYKKALNFGVYTADAAYLASYKSKVDLLRYLGVLDNIGGDIGLGAVLSNEMSQMFQDKNANIDSLFRIADQLYLRSFDRLIENQKGEDLCFILYGAWIETMHLAFESSKGFKKSPKLNKYIANQKLIAENLLSYLLDFQDNVNVVVHTEELGEVLTIFDNMDCVHEKTKVNAAKNSIAISGGTKCSLNAKVYDDLKERITSLRTKIIE